MSEILRTDVNQYPDHYRVYDAAGNLVALVEDTYGWGWVVDELSPDARNWHGFSYKMTSDWGKNDQA